MLKILTYQICNCFLRECFASFLKEDGVNFGKDRLSVVSSRIALIGWQSYVVSYLRKRSRYKKSRKRFRIIFLVVLLTWSMCFSWPRRAYWKYLFDLRRYWSRNSVLVGVQKYPVTFFHSIVFHDFSTHEVNTFSGKVRKFKKISARNLERVYITNIDHIRVMIFLCVLLMNYNEF